MKESIGAVLNPYAPRPSSWAGRRRLVLVAASVSLLALYNLKQPAAGIQVSSGLDVETIFLGIPNEASALETSRLYATTPHWAGSPNDLKTAKEFLRVCQHELGAYSSIEPIYAAGSAESREATLSIPKTNKPRAWIDTYYPVMNTPLDRSVQVLDDGGSIALDINLAEVSDDIDSDASKYSDALPPFHGLSRGGNVTGEAFNGGYCTKREFDHFSDQDIILEGKIILCKYGRNFRGLKVKAAQEAGAVGVLIYSDVNDDGTVTEKNGYLPYPHGPARNPTSVQRGSVQFISMYPGDPTTPGYPSYENSTRTEGLSIPSIPSLPISWASAEQLLTTLNPEDRLYRKQIRIVNNVDNRVIPIWNTMAVIPGHIQSEVVVLGNHRDAWVLGATDPSSGTASVHEVIRGLGHLLRKGWKPLRTILIASWDAEEYGLIGSTEWGEDFSDFINEHVVAYLNIDSATAGSRLRPASSPLLAHLVRDTAIRIPHPTDANRTLWDARLDDGDLFGNSRQANQKQEALRGDDEFSATSDTLGVNPLGSGSDYTVFLQRLGVPSTNGGFASTYHDPVYHYHSVFDSQRWQELYGDPGFHKHVAIAKHLGLQLLGISDSAVLPFNATHYASELHSYLDKVEQLASQASLHISFHELRRTLSSLYNASVSLDSEGRRLEKKLLCLVNEWKRKQGRRHGTHSLLKHPVQSLGWKCKGKDRLLLSSIKEAYAVTSIEHDLSAHPPKFPIKKLKEIIRRIHDVNKKLIAIERGFISEDGIKDREWYRHLGVAPGKWLGYGATTFPALTEAITLERNATLGKLEGDRLRTLLDKVTKIIEVN